MKSYLFKHRTLHAGFIFVIACSICFGFTPVSYAITSEDLYAEVESIMADIDTLQTEINEEQHVYETALSEYEQANAAAEQAQLRIEKAQRDMLYYQANLASLVKDMYKSGGSISFVDVLLDSHDFDEFLTGWDSISAVSGKNAELVDGAKAAKAAEVQAKADFEKLSELSVTKMNEAQEAKRAIETKQEALRLEAEKISDEAAALQAQEDLQRSSALQAAVDSENALRAQREAEETMVERLRSKVENDELTLSVDSPDSEALKKHEEELEKLMQFEAELAESQSVQSSVLDFMDFSNPLSSGSFSSGFGYRSLDGGTFHKGLDIAANQGTPYYAAQAGTVILATNDGSYNGGAGNWVVIAHGNGFVTKYMHSSKVYVKPGEVVEKGQKIGAVGNTGQSYGPHLHFQIEYNGIAVDPAAFL